MVNFLQIPTFLHGSVRFYEKSDSMPRKSSMEQDHSQEVQHFHSHQGDDSQQWAVLSSRIGCGQLFSFSDFLREMERVDSTS